MNPVCPSNCETHLFSLIFHIFIFLSLPPEAIILLSAIWFTVNKQSFSDFIILRVSPVFVFHILIVSSELADTILLPLSNYVKDIIKCLCPEKLLTTYLVCIFINVIRSSPPPLTIKFFSSIICIDYIWP